MLDLEGIKLTCIFSKPTNTYKSHSHQLCSEIKSHKIFKDLTNCGKLFVITSY